MHLLNITGTYAAAVAFIYLLLSIYISLKRVFLKTSLGDGGNTRLNQIIRAHGNFNEYVPLVLILMMIYELNLGHADYLHFYGIVLIISRFFHILGVGFVERYDYERTSLWRFIPRSISTILTYANIALLSYFVFKQVEINYITF